MRDRPPPTVLWSDEPGAAGWLADRLDPAGGNVASVVPTGYAAVARILHPVVLDAEPDAEPWTPAPRVRWDHIARHAGVEAHPLLQWPELVGATPDPAAAWAGRAPRAGSLVLNDLRLLLRILEQHTATPHRCWFTVWDGYDWLPGDVPDEARVHLGGLPLVLHRGNMGKALAFMNEPVGQSPTLWWPDDHAWCVTSPIGLRSTYVAGPAALVDTIVADRRLEAMIARYDDPVGDGA